MKKFIKNLLIGLVIIISIIGGQPVFAADDDLNTYVYNHLENWDTEFEIPYYKSDVLDVVKDIAKKDDYLSISLNKLVYQRRGDYATLKVAYKTTKDQEEYVNAELQKIINSIIHDNMNDYDKVKAINKYLVDRYEYDDTFVSNNAYSALTTGKTTCQGYALTTYKMLNLAGVENRIVVGELDGVPHGWNLVKLNNRWYNLDVTNNDALSSDKYFLKCDEVLKNDEFTWNADEYPKCDKDYDPETDNESILNENMKITNNITQNVSKNNDASSNNKQEYASYKSNIDGKWLFSNSTWYFLTNSGKYATGWNIIDNHWYCLDNSGVMKTGWIFYNGKWYYCDKNSGAMATNTTIEGYKVDSSGAWVA